MEKYIKETIYVPEGAFNTLQEFEENLKRHRELHPVMAVGLSTLPQFQFEATVFKQFSPRSTITPRY